MHIYNLGPSRDGGEREENHLDGLVEWTISDRAQRRNRFYYC